MSALPRFCCVLLCLGAVSARAAFEQKFPPAPGAKEVPITVISPFDRLPPTGYAPLEIKINNAAEQVKKWDFNTSSSYYGGRRISQDTRFTFGVEGGTARSFKVLVPLCNGPAQIWATGPGIIGGSVIGLPSASIPGSSSLTPFLGLSDSLAPRYGGQFEKAADDGKHKLAWTPIRTAEAQFPDDWRGLAGFEMLWLLPTDLAALSPEQRNALRDWVSRGGTLALAAANRPADFAEEGLGQIHTVGEGEFEVAKALAMLLRLEPARSQWFAATYKTGWGLYDDLGDFRPNVALLGFLLIIFALLVGPLNLYVFAGSHQRSRLLWTTPLISLAASLVFVVLILFRDGLGGDGERLAVVHLLPGQRKAAIVQEQLSRAGVLTRTDFQTANDTLIEPITPEEFGRKTDHSFSTSERQFEGDWFASRSVQAQWLETVIPSRAEVRLVNKDEIKEKGGAPAIVSSMDVPLSDFYYVEDEQTFWYAPTVRTGERTPLARVDKLPKDPLPGAGGRLKVFYPLTSRAGHFFATATTGSVFQETLKSIRWKKQRALVFGALPEANP